MTMQSKLRKLYALEERLTQLEPEKHRRQKLQEKISHLEKLVKEAKKRNISTVDAEKALYAAKKGLARGSRITIEEIQTLFVPKEWSKEAENELQVVRHKIQELEEKFAISPEENQILKHNIQMPEEMINIMAVKEGFIVTNFALKTFVDIAKIKNKNMIKTSSLPWALEVDILDAYCRIWGRNRNREVVIVGPLNQKKLPQIWPADKSTIMLSKEGEENLLEGIKEVFSSFYEENLSNKDMCIGVFSYTKEEVNKIIAEEVEEDMVVCGGCEARVPASSKRCPNCGAEFEE